MPDATLTQDADRGMLLNGMDAVWYNTADPDYYQYTKQCIDNSLAQAGAHPLLNVALGQQLLLLYGVTQDAKYYKAAALLHKQLDKRLAARQWKSPRDARALYMAESFHAEYASHFGEPQDFADITRQFLLEDKHDHFRHAPISQQTAWYMMAVVDSLAYYPRNDPGRASLIRILHRTAASVVRHQDPVTGLWRLIPDNATAGEGFGSSADYMFAYALQKAVRMGYLTRSYSDHAASTWQAMLAHTAQPVAVGKDMAETAAFLLASAEMEVVLDAGLARGQTILIDAWFNSQQRLNAAGKKEYFHYKWNDYSDSGFSMFGETFKNFGAELSTLYGAPTLEKLSMAQYYIIVSPDIPVKNPHPHYARPEDADQVEEWVKQGGVLLLMENDSANADIDHFNLIADRFGIHFNSILSHHVLSDDFAAGQITVKGNSPPFLAPHTLYMKDTCTLSLNAHAVPLLEDKGDTLMAKASYGKGVVIAVADPWLYNEYTDGRKTLPVQDNYAAGKEFVRWLLEQRPIVH